MFGWDDAHEDYKKTQQSDNKAELSHEVLAGGASFMAMKAWEDHQRKEGKEVNHAFAKEAIAAIAGVEVDRIAEMNGADYMDERKKEHAKKAAKEKSGELYDQHYGKEDNYNPNKQRRHKKLDEEFGN